VLESESVNQKVQKGWVIGLALKMEHELGCMYASTRHSGGAPMP